MMLLEPIQLPQKVEFEKETYSSYYGKCEISALEPGYATTIGNTLRRILLSSIQGAAARFVRIEGLHHEFSPIPGTDIDFTDFILNIKKVIFTSDSLNEVKLTLSHSGKGPVTAEMIEETADVKVINKDLVLFNIVEDTDVFIEIWVGVGRGYVPADKQITDDKPVGTIPIDSIYSPITKVNFVTENCRVGERTDFDKLVIEIHTNGAVEPQDALYLSAKLLKDIYTHMVKFEKEPEYLVEETIDPEVERMEKLLNMSVKELELTVRAANCLQSQRIETIRDLVKQTESQMLKYRNFGKKSLDELKEILKRYGLSLGMDIRAFSPKTATKDKTSVKEKPTKEKTTKEKPTKEKTTKKKGTAK